MSWGRKPNQLHLKFWKVAAVKDYPVFFWVMNNINISTDPAWNIKPDKAKSSEKVDEAAALIMALDRCIGNEGVAETSVYDERDLMVF